MSNKLIKMNDLVESISYSIKEENFPPRGIVVKVHLNAIDIGQFTVDVMWNSGKLEKNINPHYLKVCK